MHTWIETKVELPQSGIPVLVFVQGIYDNKTRRLRAEYAAKFALIASEEDEISDYNEIKDEYYCPEGWYESNEFEEIHYRIDGEVTHWMPLPDPPEEATLRKDTCDSL